MRSNPVIKDCTHALPLSPNLMPATRSTLYPRSRWARGRVVFMMICWLAIMTLASFATVSTARAAGQAIDAPAANSVSDQVCFAVADELTVANGPDSAADTLTMLDPETGITDIIGATTTQNIEAISFGPNGELFAANGGTLGTLDKGTGVFTPRAQPFGVAGGSAGNITLTDVDGIAFDLVNNILYGVHRRPQNFGGPPPDILFAINPETGEHIPGHFGGDDYVIVPEVVDDEGNTMNDVDDIQVDPVTGVLYGVMNLGGSSGVLVTIDVTDGTPTVIGTFRDAVTNEVIDDIEGISFSNDGVLYVSTGDNLIIIDPSNEDDLNALYAVNPATAQTTFVGYFPAGPKDYEGLACLSAEAAIVLRKYTNGPDQTPDDADEPTGPEIQVGDTVTWTFTFTNTGVLTLTNFVLVDDPAGVVGPSTTCVPPGTTLAPGLSLTCTMTGIAAAGQYSNVATITAESIETPLFPPFTVSDTNPSHYFGLEPSLDIVATPMCVLDAPYLQYSVTPVNFTPGPNPVTIRWINVATNDIIYEFTNQPLSATVLWPEAAVDGEGRGIEWPGWTFENGQWVDNGSPLRPQVRVEIEVNPEESFVVDYPPATPTCVTSPRASLGDRVWQDTNEDGVQDAGEPGLPDVTVTLYSCSDTQVGDPVVTDENGEYLFSDLVPGCYYVTFTQPTDFTFTTPNVGDDASDSDANPANGQSAEVTLAGGEVNRTVDAGLVPDAPPTLPASLGDRVWQDTDEDGVQDTGESGLAGVTVTLLTDSCSTETGLTTVTDDDGLYLFSDLAPGSYCVQFSLPDGYLFTTPNVGDDGSDSDANPSNGRSASVTLASGETNLTVDAGLVEEPTPALPATLGDRVWQDLNENGVQDTGEPGLAGVTVTLLTDSCSTETGLTTVTDDDGMYLFTDLTPGSYCVQFSLPDGYLFTTPNVGDDGSDSDANPANGRSASVTLVAGQTNLTVDAGLVEEATNLLAGVGDVVWFDENRNGLQDGVGTAGGEQGIPNVTISLIPVTPVAVASTASPDASTALAMTATTVTDENGRYLFTGLPPGDYYIEFIGPEEYGFTTPDAENNTMDDVDSDAQVPFVTVDVTDSVDEVLPGENVSYTISYTNTNPTLPAVEVFISTTVPAGTTFVAAESTPGWDCADVVAESLCTFPIASVPAGGSGAVEYVVRLLDEDESETVPPAIFILVRLVQSRQANTQIVTLVEGEENLTLDAGLVPIQNTGAVEADEDTPTNTVPTNLPPSAQPQQREFIYLPSLLSEE